MLLEMLKGKIHRARITQCYVDYEGSLEIDIELMEKDAEQALCEEFKIHVRKLHREKEDLVRQYGDYFTEEI